MEGQTDESTTDETKPDKCFSTKPRSPRRVLIHSSEIPSKAWFNKILAQDLDLSETEEENCQPKWLEGHMLWAKVRGYPYWPCMVSRDPFSKLFVKSMGCYKVSLTYHVQFFGASSERSWVNEASLLEFEGREKFLDIVQYGLENPEKGCKAPNQFKISTAWYPAWSLAVAEAEAAYKLCTEDRYCQYAFQYVLVKGEEQKPVDTLLEMIWKRSSGQLRTNQEGTNSEDDLYGEIFSVKRERPWYDSDDFYSSDDSLTADEKPNRRPIKIAVREGLFDVFCAKHARFVGQDHPDWDKSQITEYLRQQWSLMSYLQRSRYTSRHQKPLYVEIRKYKKQAFARIEDVEDVDPHSLDLEIEKLTTTAFKAVDCNICLVCESSDGTLLCCQGVCGRYFHTSCMDRTCGGGLRCFECSSDVHVCFACNKADKYSRQCIWKECNRFYHEECVGELRLAIMDKNGFICPLHTCVTCMVESNSFAREGPFCQCVRCPTAYHASHLCIAAGSQVLGQNQLVCPRHFKPVKSNSLHSRVNVKRCMECGNGDGLWQCQACPAAYHEECGITSRAAVMKMARMLSDSGVKKKGKQKEIWYCADCVSGRMPLNGDIVWIKLGFYRWWPGEVCHPSHVPKKVQDKVHQVGEFPVRFFGSHDFAWIHQGRIYPFDKGDVGGKSTVVNALDETFVQGVREATVAFRLCANTRRMMREQQREEFNQRKVQTEDMEGSN